MSEEIDAQSLSYGSSVEFQMGLQRKGRSLLYFDPDRFMEILQVSKLYQPEDLEKIEEEIQNRSLPRTLVDDLIVIIQENGIEIDIGAEKTFVLDNQFLYIEHEFIIESISIMNKTITDFQEGFFDILNMERDIGTICFVSKNINPRVLFKIGTDRMRIRMRHLADVIINSNRTLHLLVVSMIMQIIEDERIIIKPVAIEIAREPQQTYLESLKKNP